MAIQSINPATGEKIAEQPLDTPEQVARKLEEAQEAFAEWKHRPFSVRAERLRAVAGSLRRQKEPLARQITLEMGKPISQAQGEIEKCAWVCDYYADNAEAFLEARPVSTEAHRSYVAFEPLGLVLAVMPWNFPFWQVFRAAAPALMAGNGMVLKHASNVPGCAQAIERLFHESGDPAGIFRVLWVGSDELKRVIDHRAVQGVTLTGSPGAGRQTASLAGQALKKTVLELGGSDPYLVLDDADIEAAATICVQSRLINSGQSCIAGKRFIVVRSVYQAFEARMVDKMRAAKVGDPLDPAVEVGPLARADLRDELHRQVRQSTEQGAECLLGGTIPEGKGSFYPPTVMRGVVPGMPVYDEETFGPVAVLLEAPDETTAIELANQHDFGLGAAVLTSDPSRGERIAAGGLRAGACFVNGPVKSDPRLPFGGIKASGYGRELGEWGIREFVNIKTVVVA